MNRDLSLSLSLSLSGFALTILFISNLTRTGKTISEEGKWAEEGREGEAG